jgi:hypothetical protein
MIVVQGVCCADVPLLSPLSEFEKEEREILIQSITSGVDARLLLRYSAVRMRCFGSC